MKTAYSTGHAPGFLFFIRVILPYPWFKNLTTDGTDFTDREGIDLTLGHQQPNLCLVHKWKRRLVAGHTRRQRRRGLCLNYNQRSSVDKRMVSVVISD